MLDNLLMREEVFTIVGAAMEVHSVLGCGFLESVYQEALALELRNRDVLFLKQERIEVFYKGRTLEKYFVVDFLCFGEIVVEIKALASISSEHEAQLLNYLKVSNHKVGILINFGTEKLEFKRMVF